MGTIPEDEQAPKNTIVVSKIRFLKIRIAIVVTFAKRCAIVNNYIMTIVNEVLGTVVDGWIET